MIFLFRRYPSSHTLPDTTLTHERTAHTVENTNGCDETETCDEDVEIVEPQPSNVASTSLVPKNDACSQSSEASGLIYKKVASMLGFFDEQLFHMMAFFFLVGVLNCEWQKLLNIMQHELQMPKRVNIQ